MEMAFSCKNEKTKNNNMKTNKKHNDKLMTHGQLLQVNLTRTNL